MRSLPIAYAILSLLSAALFVADLRGYFNVTGKPVAFVRAINGSARRLGQGQLTWDHAGAGTLFADGDTIASGEESRVKLGFYAGGELDLDPGAMVRLGGSTDNLQLNFVQGTGRVKVARKAEGKVTVQRANSPKNTAAGASAAKHSVGHGARDASGPESRIEVSVVDDDDASVAPIKTLTSRPEATREDLPIAKPILVEKLRNPAQALNTGGSLVIDAWVPPAPKLVDPVANATVWLNDAISPELQWLPPPAKTGEKVHFEVSLRPLNGAEKTLVSESPRLTLPELPVGRYVWSVRAVRADGRRGPASEERPIQLKLITQLNKVKIRPVEVE